MTRLFITVSIITLIISAQTGSHPQGIRKIAELGTEINNAVSIEGFVARYQEDTATTNLYQLQDDWGDFVLIRTARQLPPVGERIRVTGTVTIDPKLNVPSIIEDDRIPMPAMAHRSDIASKPDTDKDGIPDTEDECPGKAGPQDNRGCPTSKNTLYVLIGAIIIVFSALVCVLLKIRSIPSRGPSYQSPRRSDPSSSPIPEPVEFMEGATIRMHVPPPNTLKLLPGYFEVVAGETEIEEIRLFKTTHDPEIETTIGRLPGEPYRHIQLKLQTVSRKQAKLVFANGAYRLINYAPETSNPTMINGREMAVNESHVLEEGDRIQMGEVELIYHDH